MKKSSKSSEVGASEYVFETNSAGECGIRKARSHGNELRGAI
jgi:hypothetical protein